MMERGKRKPLAACLECFGHGRLQALTASLTLCHSLVATLTRRFDTRQQEDAPEQQHLLPQLRPFALPLQVSRLSHLCAPGRLHA
jgi:hypothetical protein